MKRRQFTLIELLVVISVIVILIGIATPVFVQVRKKAKRAKAKGQISQLMTAIAGYQSTYQFIPTASDLYQYERDQYLPQAVKNKIGTTPTEDFYGQLMSALAPGGNPRKIAFLSLQTPGTFADPWSNSFKIAADMNFDGTIDEGVIYGSTDPINAEYVVWSMGPDGEHSATDSDATNKDNVNSWSD